MNKKTSSPVINTKKKKVLISCAMLGFAGVMAGGGVGIGYALWHKPISTETSFSDESPYANSYNFWVGKNNVINAPSKPKYIYTNPTGYRVDDHIYTVVNGSLPAGLRLVTTSDGLPWFEYTDSDGPTQTGNGSIIIKVSSPTWPKLANYITFNWIVSEPHMQDNFTEAFSYQKDYVFFNGDNVNTIQRPETPSLIWTLPNSYQVRDFYYKIDTANTTLPTGVTWDCNPDLSQTQIPWITGTPTGVGATNGKVVVNCSSPSWPDITECTFEFNWETRTKGGAQTSFVDAFPYMTTYNLWEGDIEQTPIPRTPTNIFTNAGDTVSNHTYTLISCSPALPEGMTWVSGDNGLPWFIGVPPIGSKGKYEVTVGVTSSTYPAITDQKTSFFIEINDPIEAQTGFSNASPYKTHYNFSWNSDDEVFAESMDDISRPYSIQTFPGGDNVTDHVYTVVSSELPPHGYWYDKNGLPIIRGGGSDIGGVGITGTIYIEVTSPSWPNIREIIIITWDLLGFTPPVSK